MVTGGHEEQLLRWIPLLPLLAAAYHGVMLGFVRRTTSRWLVIGLSCGSVFLSFFISCWVFAELIQIPVGSRLLVDGLYTWIGAGVGGDVFSVEFGFALDPISSVMSLIVTGVGLLIHVYSIGYMDDDHRDDKGFQRFFCYMNLFIFAMLVLVLADNLVFMFLGWEGVGLCSYLLIGFWYSDRFNAFCGSKAFIVNRIGDFGFLVGILILFGAMVEVGTPGVGFAEITQEVDRIAKLTIAVPAWLPWGPEWKLVNVIALCFFIGACGKSAQIPLYVWLPDAMAGPTPVSALIHAATMVTAGVYMVCRLSFLFSAAPEASAIVAWTGGITAFLAATIAITQNDIKKVLAYSTVSQLGYMFMAAGCGAYEVALFHLGTHAFFKALLFLAAGAVILAMHHEQDIEKMGGLRRSIWQTHAVFAVGVVANAGFPPFSGFFSKDEILLTGYASHVPGHMALYWIGAVTAGITSFYMFRLYFKTFFGECRAPAEVREHARDPSGVVLNPLWVLAFFTAFAGFVGLPQVWGDLIGVENSNSLGNFLAPALAARGPFPLDEVSHATEYGIASVAFGMSVAGFALAWLLYVKRPDLPGRIESALAGSYRLLVNKYYVDELYDAVVVRPLVKLSDRLLWRIVDDGAIDGVAINGTARAVRALAANGLKYAQSGLTQSYLFIMIVGSAAIVGYLLR